MNTYISGFTRGRELLKKLLVSDVICAVLAMVTRGTPMVMGLFSGATLLLFIAIIYIDVKFCRCPHCGKVILLGVLAIDTCPRCKHNLVSGKKAKKSR